MAGLGERIVPGALRYCPATVTGLLTERTIVVTGVGPGLGRAIARACGREGATVVLAARSAERLAAMVAELAAEGATAVAVPTDVTDEDQRRRLVAAAAEASATGAIDGLVNSAFQQPPMVTVEDTDPEVWRAAFEINCHAAVQLTRAALPALRAAAAPSVVMITTLSVHTSRPRFGAYAAAKSATSSAARTLAAELGPDGIRVNCVAPGYIWGEPVRWYLDYQAKQRGVLYETVEGELLAEIPLRRIPTPEAIADAVVFYLSAMSRDITGTTLDVNGGQYTRP